MEEPARVKGAPCKPLQAFLPSCRLPPADPFGSCTLRPAVPASQPPTGRCKAEPSRHQLAVLQDDSLPRPTCARCTSFLQAELPLGLPRQRLPPLESRRACSPPSCSSLRWVASGRVCCHGQAGSEPAGVRHAQKLRAGQGGRAMAASTGTAAPVPRHAMPWSCVTRSSNSSPSATPCRALVTDTIQQAMWQAASRLLLNRSTQC